MCVRQMPDRIWARRNRVFGGTMQPSWGEQPYADAIPYIRADIAAEQVVELLNDGLKARRPSIEPPGAGAKGG